MLFYFGLLAVVTIVGMVLQGFIKNKKSARIIFCAFSFLVLGSLSAFRFSVGYDYDYIYVPLYEPILSNPFIPFSELVHEPGFVMLERLIALASPNYQMLFVVTSYLIVGLFMLYYYLYSPSPVVSVFLFLALSHYYCSMNFIRQTLASAICLFAIPFLQKKQFWRYCLIVLTASLFHTSALIMLAFYLINLIPVNGYTISIYLPIALILYLSSSGMLTLAVRYIYSHYDMGNPEVAEGFPPGFLITSAAFLLLLFLARRVLTRRDKKNYIYVNYSFFAFLFIFLGTKHAILDRFTLFFELAVPVGAAIVLCELRADLPGPRDLWRTVKAKAITCELRKALASYWVCLLVTFAGGATAHYYALNYDFHGVIPYQLVFDQPFYQEYAESAGDIGLEPVDEPVDEPADMLEEVVP